MSRLKNRLLQTPLVFNTGLGRLKTGSDRLRVDFHTGLGQEFGLVRSSRFEEVWATCWLFLYSGQDRGNWVKVIEGLGQVWARLWTDMGQASGIGLGLVLVTSGEGFWTGLGGRGQV